MPDISRFPEQLGIQVYTVFVKDKRFRQVRKLVLANKITLNCRVLSYLFGCWVFFERGLVAKMIFSNAVCIENKHAFVTIYHVSARKF